MKLIISTVLLLLGLYSTAFADTWLNGYTRSDGAYFQGHYISSPNNTVTDNFSYKGNINSYTGRKGSNYYRNRPISEYFGAGNSNTQYNSNYDWNQ